MIIETIITLIFTAGGAVLCLFQSWGALCKARRIEDTPTSKISSAAQGYVELIGIAKADQALLIAPLTNTPCLWYRYRVEQYQKRGKRSSWRVVRSGTSETSFFLEDDSGQCHVHPEGAEVSSYYRDRWHGSKGILVATEEGILDAQQPVWGDNLSSGGRYRYTEERIQPEDLLYGIGLFQSVHALSSSAQTENKMLQILAEWKRDYKSLLARFDSDSNGTIDMDEWNRARQEAALEAKTYVLENYDGLPAHILCKSPIRKQHFILSCRNPHKLVKEYRLKSLLLFIAFIALVYFSVHLTIS